MKKLLFVPLAVVFLLGCASNQEIGFATLEPSCDLIGCPTVHGMVHFEDQGDGSIEVRVTLTGVPPGQHDAHIQQSGQCSGNDGDPTPFHAGDLGDVTADETGRVLARLTTDSISPNGLRTNSAGHTFVLDERADHPKSQPSGDSGRPIACAVIQGVEPREPSWLDRVIWILVQLALR